MSELNPREALIFELSKPGRHAPTQFPLHASAAVRDRDVLSERAAGGRGEHRSHQRRNREGGVVMREALSKLRHLRQAGSHRHEAQQGQHAKPYHARCRVVATGRRGAECLDARAQ